ncbi:hypothetical protein EHS25_003146 [Saitozyma podzolica]|uniref:tRNA dimethylallyltransferase n=1 Tax=Saitozyma podzolica TaxID=1890683 RepID=A0A427Y851_9TREE|nr:hypothetical protein EHS25_003146 [Saitozyma podzolica]
MATSRPIVAVIGTTGVGKSQLAVSLAQSIGNRPSPVAGPSRSAGIVLSADSMQLYKGLDVITNKVTLDEMGGVEHWGLDVVQPGQGESWELGKWCTEAERKHFLFPPPELSLSRPSPNGKAASEPLALRWTPPGPQPPISLEPELQSFLDTFWTLDPVWPGTPTLLSPGAGAGPSSSSRPILSEDSQLLALHRLLVAVDPQEAGRWHWRDGRKVRRALERWWERGSGHGEAAQSLAEGDATPKGRHARFRTLIFWVYEPMENLRPRLDQRVDKMVDRGLLEEIIQLREIARGLYGDASAVDHTEGIFQSIGYKEFASLQLPQPDPTRDPAFPSMLARMKLSTHQYAKSQLKWIRKQLLPAVREAMGLGDVAVYVVHGGERGETVAKGVLAAFLRGEDLPDPNAVGHPDAPELLALLQDIDGSRVPDTAGRQLLNSRKDCDLCSVPGQPHSVMVKDWDVHLRSKLHKRNLQLADGGRDAFIAAQKAEGMRKKAERDALREAKAGVANGDQSSE